MATWTEFALAAPGLAAAIRAAIHQYGPGLAYLGTVRPDGGPRLHPVSPVVTDDGLFCCLLDTPKRRDLDRDARYALHVYPPDDSDDEAGLRGSARAVTDPIVIQRVSAYARATPAVPWRLYAFDVELAFLVRRPAGRAAAMTQMWQAPPPGGARRVQLTIRPG